MSASLKMLFQGEAKVQDVSHSGMTGELRLSALIADLWLRVDLMNADILEEEAKARVFDPRQPEYSLLARNLRARRDNLLSTIAVLEMRTGSTKVAAQKARSRSV